MKKSETPQNQPRGHVFDGIFEYDNDLPRWWVAMFVLSIIFGVGYLAWYHLGVFPSKSLADEYAEAAEEQKALAAAAAPAAAAQGFDYQASVKDAAVVGAGKEVFTTTCSPCHGTEGQGTVGPNLTDDFWLHGAKVADVEKVVSSGVLEKGMPAWGEVIGMDKVRQAVTFILSIQGSQPQGAKAPQGDPGKLQ